MVVYVEEGKGEWEETELWEMESALGDRGELQGGGGRRVQIFGKGFRLGPGVGIIREDKTFLDDLIPLTEWLDRRGCTVVGLRLGGGFSWDAGCDSLRLSDSE